MSRRIALLASVLCLFTAAVATSSVDRSKLPVLQGDPCIQSCIGSDDPICCRWHCRPIGQNPC